MWVSDLYLNRNLQINIMKIGVQKEIKNNENRVGLTPAGVFKLVKN